MRVAIFCHSLVSDWNHGNAHFLRGITSELLRRGHDVRVFEPVDSWSRENLVDQHGPESVYEFRIAYPQLTSTRYDERQIDLDAALDETDLVIVHEWNTPELVRRIGAHRERAHRYRLLFHDTHHRSATEPESMAAYDLSNYDGVLAFGEVIRQAYLDRKWAARAWTWHEAADTSVFKPLPCPGDKKDVVWIGNWGDDERTAELSEFLFEPVRSLGLRAQAYGVRYPEQAKAILAMAGMAYRGWLPNHRVPETFARFSATVHIPRRPYTEALPGIPTIRVFEALACGIPLVCSPWVDAEGLFRPGIDFLIASDGEEMKRHLQDLLNDEDMAAELVGNGLETIAAKHTCAHRVDELLDICLELGMPDRVAAQPAGAALRRTR
ncbi:MAG: glycosyltransferase [Dehalococcoidia bacterium]